MPRNQDHLFSYLSGTKVALYSALQYYYDQFGALPANVLHKYLLNAVSENMMALISGFTVLSNRRSRQERPEDLDVPAALADFIHQQRTQQNEQSM